MDRSRTGLAVALLGLLLGLAACTAPTTTPTGNTTGGTSGGTNGGNTITMQNLAFEPTSLTVKAGDTVTFKNADQVEHHVVVGTDDLGVQAAGADVTWKAPADGVYIMKCLIHPTTMQGRITVGAGGSTIGSAPAGGGGGVPGY